MLSRGAIGVSQPRQAERGCEIERRNGTRAATTLTKLPNASAGGSTIAARTTFTQPLSAVLRAELSDRYGLTSRNNVVVSVSSTAGNHGGGRYWRFGS